MNTHKPKQQTPTPLAVQVAASDGSLASVALHADPTGWTARIDEFTFFVSRVYSGPLATWSADD